MREHEREARDRDSAERSRDDSAEDAGRRPIDPDSRAADSAGPDADADAGLDDSRSGKPSPPGDLDIGAGSSGGG